MKHFFLRVIRFYQNYLSLKNPLIKMIFMTENACRFDPTCSEYTYQAIEKFGIITGSWKGMKRILRCHPWNNGGNDPI